jgi:hypothetical protein
MSIAFPNEIWGLVLAHLPLHSLTSASLVCRAWQKLLFAYLYHTVSFTQPCHLEQFAGRVTSDDDVSAHIRELVMGKERSWLEDAEVENIIREDDLEHLTIVLRAIAPRVEHFSWQLNFLPGNSEVITLLQTGCSNLRSLSLTTFGESNIFCSCESEIINWGTSS